MRSDFRCRSCGLRFTVGWSDDPPLDDGFGATAHLVCSSCGTEHRVEIALRDRGSARQRLFDVTLEAVDTAMRGEAASVFRSRFYMTEIEAEETVGLLPIEIARSVSQEIADEIAAALSPLGTVRVTEVASAPNPLHGPLRRDRFLSGMKPRFDDASAFEEIEPTGPRWGPNGEFDLLAQPCAACGARDSFVDNPLEAGDICPSCGGNSVDCVADWST